VIDLLSVKEYICCFLVGGGLRYETFTMPITEVTLFYDREMRCMNETPIGRYVSNTIYQEKRGDYIYVVVSFGCYEDLEAARQSSPYSLFVDKTKVKLIAQMILRSGYPDFVEINDWREGKIPIDKIYRGRK